MTAACLERLALVAATVSLGASAGEGILHPYPKLGGAVASVILLVSLVLAVLRARPGIGVFIRSAATVLGASVVFMAVGPMLIMLNKYIMTDLHFTYPMTLSGWGLLASGVFARGAVGCGLLQVDSQKMDQVAGCNWFKRALPIAVAKAGTLACGNAAYLFLGVGLISMLKAFTPVWIVALTKLAGLPLSSGAALLFLVPIIAGTAFVVQGDMKSSLIGIMLMSVSNLAEATSLVLTQKLLQQLKFTVTEGLYVLTLPGALILFLLAAAVEWPRMIQAGHAQIIYDHPLWFSASAILGLVVNFVGLLLVRVTSSLTMKLLGLFRNVSLVLVGVLIYKETYTGKSLLGYSVSFLGFLGYFWSQADPEGSDRLLQRLASLCSGSRYGRVGGEDADGVRPTTVGAVTPEEEKMGTAAPAEAHRRSWIEIGVR
mmetsp:Transcript_144689/g.351394  ORF Transcript_144689/g.351394 Transcript_144689/m.351394 type:complete len:429 (-) Transcript_144689:3-1289(-)